MREFEVYIYTKSGKKYGSAAFQAESQLDAMHKAGSLVPSEEVIVKMIIKPVVYEVA